MDFPKINITFTKNATQAVQRNEVNVVAIAVKDTAVGLTGKAIHLTSEASIPDALSVANKQYIARAFKGNQYAPKEVVVFPYATNQSDALKYFSSIRVNYVCLALEAVAQDITAAITWVKAERGNIAKNVFLVIPKQTVGSDHEAIIEYDGTVTVDGVSITSAQYCTRIAGLLAGTSTRNSATFAILPEVKACSIVDKATMIDLTSKGVNYIHWDGVKAKFSRAITSLVTLGDKSAEYQKIKIASALGMIREDLSSTVADNFVGKYPNNADGQAVLISAINSYLQVLARETVIDSNYTVAIDIEAKKAYLEDAGYDIAGKTDAEIKDIVHGSEVFIAVSIRPLDAIEDVTINIAI